jgi:hypothetical protein
VTPDAFGPLTPLLGSFVIVTLAEMGDKTQLIALSLASRYREPWTVMLGVLLATTLNHALASWAGVWFATAVSEQMLAWCSGSASSPSGSGRSSRTRPMSRDIAGGGRSCRRP